jgi:hypothetical protein
MQSRQWFMAVIRYLFAEVPIRVANTTQSALITKTLNDLTPFVLPADATASTNPTTGIDPNDLNQLDIYVRPIQFTVQYLLNEVTQTFDVRVA